MEERKKKEKSALTFIIALLSIVMGLVASVMIFLNPRSNTPAFPIFCISNVFESVAAGIILAQLIPFYKISKKMEVKAGAPCPETRFILFNSIPLTAISVVLVEAVMCLLNIIMARASIPAEQAPPFIAMYLSTYLPLIIPSLIICYVAAILCSKLIYKMVGIKTPPKNNEA